MDPAEFGQARDGRPMLRSNRVWITDEDFIFRKDNDTGEFTRFAWNPWPQSWTNPRWDLTFPYEERFPLFKPLRGSDNQIVLKDGLQVWIPQDLNLGEHNRIRGGEFRQRCGGFLVRALCQLGRRRRVTADRDARRSSTSTRSTVRQRSNCSLASFPTGCRGIRR